MAKTVTIYAPHEVKGKPLQDLVNAKIDKDNKELVKKYNLTSISDLTNRAWRLFLQGSLDNHL